MGRSPEEGNGNPLWCSCLENSMNRGAWQSTVHRAARVGHDLVIKTPHFSILFNHKHISWNTQIHTHMHTHARERERERERERAHYEILFIEYTE